LSPVYGGIIIVTIFTKGIRMNIKELEKLNDVDAVNQLHKTYTSIKQEIGKVIIGQEKIVNDILIALLAGGHVLLVGVPGLAKTLLIKTVSQVLELEFNRIQFTPDLMPSDITGTEIIEEDIKIGVVNFLER
jgi:MoxR-like ATPase